MNETAILLCVYLMSTFLQCNDAEFLGQIGWVYIFICAQNLGVNLVLIIKNIILTSIDGLKEKNEKKAHMAILDAREENLEIIANANDKIELKELLEE